jgi:hypothetical protein
LGTGLKITQLINKAEITRKKFMEEVFMGRNSIQILYTRYFDHRDIMKDTELKYKRKATRIT